MNVTVGVEEEYHLVDPVGFGLRNRDELAADVLAGRSGPHLRVEMLASQLEAATDVCSGLDDVRRAVLAMRREAAAAAEAHGAAILATSTHPASSLDEVELLPRDRYDRLVQRFGSVARAFNLCGCHVHVAVPDLDTAVRVMSSARRFLPLLSAMSASSPFHERHDTGYGSFRVAWLSLWQQGGPPPHLESAEDYIAVLEQLVEIGLVDESGELLWELRPSARYPTLEFRVMDVCTDVDDAVLMAALCRSLVRTLTGHMTAGEPVPEVADVVLRAARWRAARYGLTDRLWSPMQGLLMPAASVVEEVLTLLRPDLEDHDEWTTVRDLTDRLLRRGTSADRQRARFAANGDLDAVLRDALIRTAAG